MNGTHQRCRAATFPHPGSRIPPTPGGAPQPSPIPHSRVLRPHTLPLLLQKAEADSDFEIDLVSSEEEEDAELEEEGSEDEAGGSGKKGGRGGKGKAPARKRAKPAPKAEQQQGGKAEQSPAEQPAKVGGVGWGVCTGGLGPGRSAAHAEPPLCCRTLALPLAYGPLAPAATTQAGSGWHPWHAARQDGHPWGQQEEG